MTLEIVNKNFYTEKIRNVKDYIVQGDKIQIYTYVSRYNAIIFISKNECYLINLVKQKNKKVKIF